MSRLACTVTGPADAPVVVLLHAIATHGAIWAAQAAVWSARWRVVCVDLPGHGASAPPPAPMRLPAYADAVVELLDHLHIERVGLVGLSFGGMVAQAVALAHPARVQCLALAHTGARTEPAVHDVWQRRLEQAAQHGMAAQVTPTLERWFTRAFAAASPLTLEWIGAQISATSPAGYASAVGAIQALDHLDRLSAIRVPTLVLAGEADTAVPPAVAAALAGRIAGAELVVLRDAAHLGCVEQPTPFTETVGRFLSAHLPPNAR